MLEELPLTTLLSWAWTAHVIEVDNAVEAAATERVGKLFPISVAMWTNGLRVIDETGVTVQEVQTLSHARCNLGGLERWRWITVGDGSRKRDGYGTARGLDADTVLRPTRGGSYARRVVPQVIGQVEQRWRDRFGGDVIDALRAAMPAHPRLPWSPPEVNPSDGFRTHLHPGPDASPTKLPLVAVLGQTLTAQTVTFETGTTLSLPLVANFLRVLTTSGLPSRDLPRLTGVSKEAVAMAIGFLTRRGLLEAAPELTGGVRLTPAGEQARLLTDADETGVSPVREALQALLSQQSALAEGLVPPPQTWRSKPPYLAQSKRLVSDPHGALPHQPMVLHRGGWPDGA